MDDDFFARLLDHDRRRPLLADLHRHHQAMGAPAKLSTYFSHRLEQALIFFDQNPRRSGEEVECLVYDFGFMGYFDQTLERIRKGVRASFRAMGYEQIVDVRDRVA